MTMLVNELKESKFKAENKYKLVNTIRDIAVYTRETLN